MREDTCCCRDPPYVQLTSPYLRAIALSVPLRKLCAGWLAVPAACLDATGGPLPPLRLLPISESTTRQRYPSLFEQEIHNMRTSTLFKAASAALLATCVAASDVLDLHKDDFHSIVNPEDLILVEFFARACLRPAPCLEATNAEADHPILPACLCLQLGEHEHPPCPVLPGRTRTRAARADASACPCAPCPALTLPRRLAQIHSLPSMDTPSHTHVQTGVVTVSLPDC